MEHLVVAGIIRWKNKILCVQKGKTKFDYTSFKFEFPGGKVHPNETLENALKREIMEELSMEIDIKSHFLTHTHTYPDLKITLHFFLCNALNKDLKLNEHLSHQWLTKSELQYLKWAAADIPAVKLIAKLSE